VQTILYEIVWWDYLLYHNQICSGELVTSGEITDLTEDECMDNLGSSSYVDSGLKYYYEIKSKLQSLYIVVAFARIDNVIAR